MQHWPSEAGGGPLVAVLYRQQSKTRKRSIYKNIIVFAAFLPGKKEKENEIKHKRNTYLD